jgi:hypothetical protein
MECMDCYTVGIRPDHASQPISHIAGCIVGECEAEDIGREIVSLLEDIRYPRSEYLRLATPRSGNHEDWSVDRLDSFSLLGIQSCEYVLYRFHSFIL